MPVDSHTVQLTKCPLMINRLRPAALLVVSIVMFADDRDVSYAAAPQATASAAMDVKATAALIDAEIDRQLTRDKIVAAPRCEDVEFLRRASLDILGVIPTAERVESFLSDTAGDKRARLIDELLADPRYGRHAADQWVSQMVPLDLISSAVMKHPLLEWMADGFNANKPWDRMAHEILRAEGEQSENGAITFFTLNKGVDKMTGSVGRVFLGLQIQCAQCHNHPFTQWKQDDYWGLARFFYQIDMVAPANIYQMKGQVPKVFETATPVRKNNPLPEGAKELPAKFLAGPIPDLIPGEPFRPTLADWICTTENPYFSKSFVNRTWSHYFRRGLVNPIDDLREENAATHPELLDELARRFATGGFETKSLVRAICLSNTYQRTSRTEGESSAENKTADDAGYGRMPVRVLTPEELYDCLETIVGDPAKGAGPFANNTGFLRGSNPPRDRFVDFFRGSINPRPTDYETGIPQALGLINNSKLSGNDRLGKPVEVVEPGTPPADAVRTLYLKTVSRPPTETETSRLTEYVAASTDAKRAYTDILWALLNSSEFAFNH